MAYRPRGKARVDPDNPQAFAVCDRCGALYNRSDLDWQHQWQGVALQNKRIRVCEDCLDRPSMFLRAIIVPADPLPIFNARAEPYTIDEATTWTLFAIPPGSNMFSVSSRMRAELSVS